MDDQHHYYDDDEDEDEEDQVGHDEEEDDSTSVLSIPDPNINFDLVYALHTFAATVDGQASVVKGDALTLLDDSNSYWWLVKVLKTSEVGYIPAENIETPYERLARLNSHRNIELTRRDIQDAFPAPPSAKSKATKRVTLAKGVKFQAQVIFGGSDDEDDFAEEYEEWDEALLSSDTDDGSSDSDDYDYYSSHLSGTKQPTTLMIYCGNFAFGEDVKPALAYASTTAQELIQQVVDSFDNSANETTMDNAMNYYLVVKGVDGDEYTLVPSDRPLSIYHSLTGHLNTPMPSLKKARRISQLMSTNSDSTIHIGGPSYHQPTSPTSPGNERATDNTVRFYLHSKKRTIHEEGVIRIKVSLLKSEIVDQDGLFMPGQTRVDKSLSVPHTGSVGNVAALILERFHLLNGVVEGSSDLNDRIKALRIDGGSEGEAVMYRLNVFRNGRGNI
ncbi:uncharacterized protein BX664DRAFT_267199 [Halteromyces radiatus]|uniref:uncharacterized protein n=1 Tax=Halteromyces radiatus TaxID=101107 RepID=UPI00221E7372|nr:uncharacterized protein BX664DRAFT_267199 [Halteromyces radiatus]KAI8085166.1 hypothetical protein BX664DRAFT_267199 [Halteromyces radiatus]